MKKILLISHEFPLQGGGAGVVAHDTAEGLSKQGVQVTVCTNYIVGRKASKQFEFIEVKTLPKIRPYLYWQRIKKLNLEEYDRIIINDIGAAMTAAYFFGESLQRKCIVYLHGSEPEFIFTQSSQFFNIIGFKKKYIQLLENCKNIIPVSAYMKEKFLIHCNLEHLQSKMKIIYNGLDAHVFHYKPVDLYQQLIIDPEKRLLLSVSRIIEGKGYQEKYDLFKQLIDEGYDYHWIVVGEGDYLSSLKERATQDHLMNDITFVGAVSRDTLKEYYSSVDVFWLLSNLEEAFGLVYIEAMACGTPVIARKKAGALEVVAHEQTGFLVENPHQCLEILRKQKYKSLEREQLINYAQKFDIETSMVELINLF